jgi:hypothetical protein
MFAKLILQIIPILKAMRRDEQSGSTMCRWPPLTIYDKP